MLTRLVRTQLIIFTIASVVGVAVMLFAYMQVPTLLGIGRLTVKLSKLGAWRTLGFPGALRELHAEAGFFKADFCFLDFRRQTAGL